MFVATITVLRLVCCTIAVIANLFVCYVIIKFKRNSQTYLLIASQCFSDFLYGLMGFTMYLFCSESFATQCRLKLFLCEITGCIIVASFAISALSMTAIAYDRFMRLYFPYRKKPSINQTILLIIAIYVTGLILTFQTLVGFKYLLLLPLGEPRCVVSFEELAHVEFYQKLYGYWLYNITCCYIPAIATGALYTAVVWKIRKLKVIGGATDARLRNSQEKRAKNVKMLVTIVASYYLLTCPFGVAVQYGIMKTGENSTCEGPTKELWPVLRLISLISAIINPFILYYYNEWFRNSFTNGHSFANKSRLTMTTRSVNMSTTST